MCNESFTIIESLIQCSDTHIGHGHTDGTNKITLTIEFEGHSQSGGRSWCSEQMIVRSHYETIIEKDGHFASTLRLHLLQSYTIVEALATSIGFYTFQIHEAMTRVI